MNAMDAKDYASGLDLVATVIEKVGVPAPERLREAARLTEQRATTMLEMGVAAGLRIAASEIADRRLEEAMQR